MAGKHVLTLLTFALYLAVAGCNSEVSPESGAEEASSETTEPATGPDFTVKFETSKGDILIRVHPRWAPIGAAHFKMLVENGYYDGNRFYRVMPNFIIQWGINGDPAITRNFALRRLKDDPVATTNARGTITYATAGPNTRATDLFINLKTNAFLDSQGFSPFGEVIEGMSVIEAINAEYGEKPDQGRIKGDGDSYLESYFPRLDYIRKATIVP